MGDSYRELLKSRNRARIRVGQAVAQEEAVAARAKAIRETNRKKASQASQYKLRLDA